MLDDKMKQAIRDQAKMLGLLHEHLMGEGKFTRAEATVMVTQVLLMSFHPSKSKSAAVSLIDEMLAKIEKESQDDD